MSQSKQNCKAGFEWSNVLGMCAPDTKERFDAWMEQAVQDPNFGLAAYRKKEDMRKYLYLGLGTLAALFVVKKMK